MKTDETLLSGSREETLLKFYNYFIIPRFKTAGYVLPTNVKISIGVQEHKNAIGSTYHSSVGDKPYHIFISPKIARNGYSVFATLIHEAIHTMFFNHLKEFSTCAKAVGLVKPWTATQEGAELANDIDKWCFANNVEWFEPALFHEPQGFTTGGSTPPTTEPTTPEGFGLRPIGAPPRQKSRMVKLVCGDCGMIIRTAYSNIKDDIYPICGKCNTSFFEG